MQLTRRTPTLRRVERVVKSQSGHKRTKRSRLDAMRCGAGGSAWGESPTIWPYPPAGTADTDGRG
jgi:hypothetical protein